MATHPNIQSMVRESLPEMILVAKYCIEFKKDTKFWPAPGCYGYPAALILLSIVDSIGSYVEKGNIINHFKILNNIDYYGQNFSAQEIKIIYDKYRNTLSHHTVMATNVGLSIGLSNDRILQNNNGRYRLNLISFYNASVKAVDAFLNNPQILVNNKTIDNIKKL